MWQLVIKSITMIVQDMNNIDVSRYHKHETTSLMCSSVWNSFKSPQPQNHIVKSTSPHEAPHHTAPTTRIHGNLPTEYPHALRWSQQHVSNTQLRTTSGTIVPVAAGVLCAGVTTMLCKLCAACWAQCGQRIHDMTFNLRFLYTAETVSYIIHLQFDCGRKQV